VIIALRLLAAALAVSAALTCYGMPDGRARDEARLRGKYGLQAPEPAKDGGTLHGNIDVGISIKDGAGANHP
jgi:hypothetical protein